MLHLIPVNRNTPSKKTYEDDFDTFFNNFFNMSFAPALKEYGNIKVDIREEENQYVLEAEMPGVAKEDISLHAENDMLTLSVEQKEEKEEENKKYIRKERRSCSMKRSFNLENIDEEKIEAKYENGILFVHLPKSSVQAKEQKKIDIQ